MFTENEERSDYRGTLPAPWRERIESSLSPDERILAWFLPDLDATMHFGESLIVLTDRRLWHVDAVGPRTSASDGSRVDEGWPLQPGLELKTKDRAGIGALELFDPNGRLAVWRYTIARSAAARRLIDRFEVVVKDEEGETEATGEVVCPSCGAILAAGDSTCSTCA